MENKPECAGIWLGLARIGVISALININLKEKALTHSIIVSNSKVLIYESELSERM
jgi:solute carrier family 27 fatty acid transporter 1/4